MRKRSLSVTVLPWITLVGCGGNEWTLGEGTGGTGVGLGGSLPENTGGRPVQGTGGVDAGTPSTGGAAIVVPMYGPPPTGGTSGIDAGTPATGGSGGLIAWYGPAPTGGTSSIDAGTPTTGGAAIVVPMYGPMTAGSSG